MNMDNELLNYIYQNSEMGIETLSQLSDIVEDENFKSELENQYIEYKKINDAATNLLEDYGHEPKEVSEFQKLTTHLTIDMKTLVDKSPSNISEMLINGSTMGTIDCSRNLKKYKNANPAILTLNNQLLKTEENNIENLKKFL